MNTLSLKNKILFSLIQTVSISLLTAAIIGVLAQIRFSLFFTPVPITLQTLGVLLAASFLPTRLSVLSLVFYVGLGVLGVPWFQNTTGGLAVLLGPTGGYLIGFIFSAFLISFLKQKTKLFSSFWFCFAGFVLITLFGIFLPGLVGLSIWIQAVKGAFPTLPILLTMGFTPFLAGAFLKSFVAAVLVSARS